MDYLKILVSCKIKPVCIKYTDHQSVFLNFLSNVEEKGKGFWKINNSILNDKDYQDKINDIILKNIPLKSIMI